MTIKRQWQVFCIFAIKSTEREKTIILFLQYHAALCGFKHLCTRL